MRHTRRTLTAALVLGMGASVLTGCIMPPPLPSAPPAPSPSAAAAPSPSETAAASSPSPSATTAPVETPTPVPTPTQESGPALAAFAPLDEREFALLVRDPDAHVGEQLIINGVVHQFDAATGRCGFLANVGHERTTNSYDYVQNALFTAGDGSTDCPVLDDVVEDDHVKMWVTTLGSVSYDTQIGGNTTVPMFEVHQVELLPTQEF